MLKRALATLVAVAAATVLAGATPALAAPGDPLPVTVPIIGNPGCC